MPEPPEPIDSLTREPIRFDEAVHDVLTPMGQVESYGAFARGLGPRRVKIVLAAGGVIAFGLALLYTLD